MRSRYEIEEYMTKQDISIEDQNKILEDDNLLNEIEILNKLV